MGAASRRTAGGSATAGASVGYSGRRRRGRRPLHPATQYRRSDAALHQRRHAFRNAVAERRGILAVSDRFGPSLHRGERQRPLGLEYGGGGAAKRAEAGPGLVLLPPR